MLAIVCAVAILAGGVASVAGFGIGSLLTPILAAKHPATLAVAAVSIPHFVGTAYRFFLLRRHVDKSLLLSFGLMSAAGGLAGAMTNHFLASRALEIVLSCLLLFVGVGGLMGWTKKLRFVGPWAWIAGGVSGFLGGLVGNQGGLRSGAMVGLGVSRDAFVATATATGLIVDAARMPVYFWSYWQDLVPLLPLIMAMSLGVVAGTRLGMSVLKKIPEERFLGVVSLLLVALAVWLIAK